MNKSKSNHTICNNVPVSRAGKIDRCTYVFLELTETLSGFPTLGATIPLGKLTYILPPRLGTWCLPRSLNWIQRSAWSHRQVNIIQSPQDFFINLCHYKIFSSQFSARTQWNLPQASSQCFREISSIGSRLRRVSCKSLGKGVTNSYRVTKLADEMVVWFMVFSRLLHCNVGGDRYGYAPQDLPKLTIPWLTRML